ncbi:MAG: ROK family protein [Acidimicrobiia bacterium]|nr:ROK family protein [Acidimicrobiia bacterium]
MSAQRFLGLDLGGTNIKAAVVEVADGVPTPTVVSTTQHPTEADRGPTGVTDRLIEVGRATLADHGPVAAAGLGVPGLFDADSGRIVLFPNLPGPWPGHPLRDPVAAALGVPTTLINDARAFVLAEGTIGAGSAHRALVGITLGTGIGGGIMIDGRIHLGAFGTGGEVAHQIIMPDGPECGCGNRGCVEALAKGDALAALAGLPDAATVCARAAAGDEDCLAAIDTVAGYIGIGLANVVTLLGPSCIVIGGGIMAAGDLMLEPIRQAMVAHVRLAPGNLVEVVPAELGNWAGAIGAALAGRPQSDVRAR